MKGESLAKGFRDALEPHFQELAEAKPDRPDGVSDRAKDAWKPLLAIADLAGGEWPSRACHAAQVLCGNPELDEQEIGIRLMGALRDAFEERSTDKLTSFEFCEGYLHNQRDELWADWKNGKPISQRKVADLFRPFEIKPRKIRIGEDTARGYDLARCEDAFRRYLPRKADSKWNKRNNGSSKPETAPRKVEHEGEMFHFENPEKPHEQAIVPDVPLCDAPTGGKRASKRGRA